MRFFDIPLTLISLAALSLACAGELIGTGTGEGPGSSPLLPAEGANADPASMADPEPVLSPTTEGTLDDSPTLNEILSISDASSVRDGVAITSRARRLTHTEYNRAITDLVGLDPSELSNEFPEELPTLQGYFQLGSLGTTERLFQQLQRSAESIAGTLLQTPEAYAGVVKCTSADTACRDTFIQDFGRRAYRRPLTEGESTTYRDLFAAAAEWSPADAFRGGVQSVVEAMLQSPNFLYRIERGTTERDEFGVRLAGYEIATRLSFMIAGTIPDAELLAAAEAGELADSAGITRQARRLVDSPAVLERVKDFHARWAQLDELGGVAKDTSVFPQFSPELMSSMVAATDRFVEEVTLGANGGLEALLTAPYGYVDQNLAALYGLSGSFGPELQRVEFDAQSPRGGLLTQPGFLAGHSSSDTGTSPVLRGVFVLRRLLCQPIPDPPPNAQSTVPPPSETPIVTTREYFEWKTGMDACQGCHSMINPVGFAFEDFDGIGGHRTAEKGAPVDASGTVKIGDATLGFVGGKELASQIASLPEAQACYARNWLRYAWGRADTDADLRTLTLLRQGLASPDYGVRDLLVDITESAAFSHFTETEE